MASKVKFHIYFREESHVQYGLKCVILQRFIIIPSILNKFEEQTFRSVYHWLVRAFEINLYSTLVTVHVLVKWDNLWPLMSISNTNEWKTYIIEAVERGTPILGILV
jgi:hypothetical protein